MKVVVGLGNPGRRYARTRHNAGYMVVDEMARRKGARFKRLWMKRAVGARVDGPSGAVLLVKPLTFMNRSGEAVRAILSKRGLDEQDLIVVVDDVHLPLGRLRLRAGGSEGGHNGLRSISAALGTRDFARLRVGVGPAPSGDLVDYVLAPFDRDEEIGVPVRRAAEAAWLLIEQGLEQAMNRYNYREEEASSGRSKS